MANQNDDYRITVSAGSYVEKGAYASVWASLTSINDEGSTIQNPYTLTVTDRTGEEVYSDSDTSNMSCFFSIPTSDLPLGTYTATVKVFRYDSISDSATFTVVAPNSAPNPPSSITVPGGSIYSSTPVDISWSESTDPDGDRVSYELERQLDGSGSFTRIYRGSSRSYRDTIPAGTHTSVIYRVCAYDSKGKYSDYCTGPVRFVINNTAPTTPGSITVPDTIRGGTDVAISWAAATDADDNLDGYIVERSYNGGSWVQVYKGSSRTYTEFIPNNQYNTVAYRVKAYDSYGEESGYTTSPTRTIINNTAPSAPGTITIPSTILANKSFQISWGASTDTEGNLTGYKLERSVNSGSTWTQIYQGPSTSYTDTVPDGTPSVTYRVKAYDIYNAESGYKKSNTVGVINNRPPESPASITIPELILGGQPSLIKWESSNDEDHNLVGYELERQLNNTGGFTRIYKGSELQYTDTVEKGTLQVQYRVRAYDSYNAYSSYTTSSLKEVNNNTLPTITGEDTDLGTLESVSYKYTVTDPDEGQTLNVTEYIDDKVHKTLEVTSGVENTLTIDGEEFLQVGKGSHTIVISVDDGQGVLVKRTLTFTRVQTKLSTTLITPLPANEMPTRMYAFIFGNIPNEAVFHFYACNNAFDEEPTWQEVTDGVLMKKKFYFTNKTKKAEQWGVNIKFEVDRSTVPEGTEIYISKVSGGFDGYSTQS